MAASSSARSRWHAHAMPIRRALPEPSPKLAASILTRACRSWRHPSSVSGNGSMTFRESNTVQRMTTNDTLMRRSIIEWKARNVQHDDVNGRSGHLLHSPLGSYLPDLRLSFRSLSSSATGAPLGRIDSEFSYGCTAARLGTTARQAMRLKTRNSET